MTRDPRTPVLVGAGVVSQRTDDPQTAREPIELMIQALERAADDAGCRDLLARADAIRVPRGFWDYRDPGRLIAQRIGATRAHTQLCELGILQTTLFGHAARAIAAGQLDVVLIAGGEAKHRMLRAQISGREAPLTRQPEAVVPDELLRPQVELASAAELASGLHMPAGQYAMIENALRYEERLGVAEHRQRVAELWARFSAVAARNPHAWSREALDAAQIRDASERNPMLAFPYTKLHNSQWNVDQAAGLILCSLASARAAGVAEDRLVFPLAVTESNYVLPLSERPEPQRSPGFAHAGRAAFALSGLAADAIAHLELYSCFPAAVRVQARELGLSAERVLTLTGGMAFAGGPLNNFVLQAAQRMVEVLRGDPGSAGMLSAVSGYLSKQGVSLWSTRPPEGGFRCQDVSAGVARETTRAKLEPDYQGEARVASYTVLFAAGRPARGVLLCQIAPGRRSLVACDEPELLAAMCEIEICGRDVRIGARAKSGSVAVSLLGGTAA